MTPLDPKSLPHSHIAIPSVSLLQGKTYVPSFMHKEPEYLNGRNGLLVRSAFYTPVCLMQQIADEYQRDAIAEANAARDFEESADDMG